MADNASKQIESSTKIIARQLEEFEKNRKTVVSRLEAAEKGLKELGSLTKRALESVDAKMQAMQDTRKQIDCVLAHCACINRTVEASKGSEMVERRLLDARKAYKAILDDWNEKSIAYENNKADRKCKTEFEIVNKAFQKVAGDCADLERQASELMPAGMMDFGEVVTRELPDLMKRYEAEVVAMLKGLGDSSMKWVSKELEFYLEYKPRM